MPSHKIEVSSNGLDRRWRRKTITYEEQTVLANIQVTFAFETTHTSPDNSCHLRDVHTCAEKNFATSLDQLRTGISPPISPSVSSIWLLLRHLEHPCSLQSKSQRSFDPQMPYFNKVYDGLRLLLTAISRGGGGVYEVEGSLEFALEDLTMVVMAMDLAFGVEGWVESSWEGRR